MNKFPLLTGKKNYFEGWYFKHQNGQKIAAFIPGICKEKNGKSYAFIQLLFNHKSYWFNYALTDCEINRKKFYIRIGKNIFSKKGIYLDIKNDEISLKGKLLYGTFHPIGNTIMGPFRYLPGMECKHEIISMYHNVKGELTLDGEPMIFSGGLGYIEKDWGFSFPSSYTWLHCNQFDTDKCSIMVSVADIPYHGINFKGCICAISYNEKNYRLATYLGVKILVNNKQRIYLKQGKYLLKIMVYNDSLKADRKKSELKKTDFQNENSINEEAAGTTKVPASNTTFSHKLLAPDMGAMKREIAESHLCYARFLLYEKKQIIFDLTSKEVSMEFVEE